MISSQLGSSFYDTTVTVPEMGEMDFDLGTMDTFEDLDININNYDMLGDTTSDPFGDFNLEQSFNLIELNNMFNSSSSSSSDGDSLLEDLDAKETLKQDIMWSSAHTPGHHINNRYHCSSSSQQQSSSNKLGLTPPSSYINQVCFESDSPHFDSSDEDTCPSNVSSPTHVSDHCYTSLTNSSHLLTPPESSEDEDSGSISLFPSPSAASCSNFSSKSRKSCLASIDNDRLNSTGKSLVKKNLTTHNKAKFKFSVRMKKSSKLPYPPIRRTKASSKKNQKSSRITISSYQAMKENKESLQFSQPIRQTINVPGVDHNDEKLLKTELKLNNREARDVHNQMERKRRSDLNRAYAILKDFVPSIANSDRTSKQMVLDKAIEHCKMLKTREETSREQRKKLSQQNEQLRKKLQLLESQLAASQVENAEWEIQGW